jgi:uncharacterized protein
MIIPQNSTRSGTPDLRKRFDGDLGGERRGALGRRTMLRDDNTGGGGQRPARNVLGEPLEICSFKPMTGFYRDGCCNTGQEDIGSHTVCAVMTSAFLDFSKSRGNDLSTPLPEFGVPGLKPGDRWCLCAARWQEAGGEPSAACDPARHSRECFELLLAHRSQAARGRLSVTFRHRHLYRGFSAAGLGANARL